MSLWSPSCIELNGKVSNANGEKEKVRKKVDWTDIQQDAFPEKYGPEWD